MSFLHEGTLLLLHIHIYTHTYICISFNKIETTRRIYLKARNSYQRYYLIKEEVIDLEVEEEE